MMNIRRRVYLDVPSFSNDSTSFSASVGQGSHNRNFLQKVQFEPKRQPTSTVSCKYCKKTGHTVDKCYRLHGFPQDFKFTKNRKGSTSCVQNTDVPTQLGSSSSSSHGFTKEQYQQIMSLIQHAHVTAPLVSTSFNYESSFSENAAYANFADLGATNNMTPHKHFLHNLQPLFAPFLITLPNGYKVKVISTGSLHLRHDITLHNAPSLKRPLKIGKAAKGLYFLHPDASLIPVSCSNSPAISSFIPVNKCNSIVNFVSHCASNSVSIPTLENHSASCISPNTGNKTDAFVSMVKINFHSNVQTFRFPSNILMHISPFEKLHGNPPSYSHLRYFGYLAYASSPNPGRDKFQPRSITAVFLGYPCGKKGYKLLNLDSHSVFCSRDVPLVSSSPHLDSSSSPPPASPSISPSLSSSSTSPLLVRKSSRTINPPSYLSDYVCSHVQSSAPVSSFTKLSTSDIHAHEPQYYQHAASHPAWQEAMLKEFEALDANHTWDVIALPPHKKAIPCYTASKNDYSLFTKVYDGSLVVLAVYVDDILLAGDNLSELDALKAFLDAQFKIKDLGCVHYFLGLEITSHPTGYLVNQLKYASDLLAEFSCQHFSLVVTHLDPSLKLLVDVDAPLADVGLHVLRYIMNDPAQGILLSHAADFSLKAYSNSDWAACANSRKLVTRFFITLGDSPISWKSKKQPTISLSSAEAEYRALRMVVAELSWLHLLLAILGLSIFTPIPVFCDSMAALHIAKKPVFHERTKHIEVDCHFVRDCLFDGIISLHFISTGQQLADILTNPCMVLPTDLFCPSLGCSHPPS
uniref:Reverse transcriptase Ty1/copia-type domain-containing protein n=1 Tax=Nicotiana tabacum TaxID=4097 RepID=A0A1S3XUZ8_TOBAC|nr:PREDICTED: uncharacterized protein LOC107769033 [Nicotiana tabacum]